MNSPMNSPTSWHRFYECKPMGSEWSHLNHAMVLFSLQVIGNCTWFNHTDGCLHGSLHPLLSLTNVHPAVKISGHLRLESLRYFRRFLRSIHSFHNLHLSGSRKRQPRTIDEHKASPCIETTCAQSLAEPRYYPEEIHGPHFIYLGLENRETSHRERTLGILLYRLRRLRGTLRWQQHSAFMSSVSR